MICKFCGKEYSIKGIYSHEKFCANNPEKLIRVSPFKGKKHTPETIEKCKNAAIKQHESGLGTIPPSWKGRTHTSETKTKISNSMKGNQNANHRGDRQSFYNDIRMDSSWEVLVAQYFDKHNIIWSYNVHGYRLSDNRIYYPDFFIYEKGEFIKLIEVKGYFREENKLKYELFKKEYPNIIIELWDKPQLKLRGII